MAKKVKGFKTPKKRKRKVTWLNRSLSIGPYYCLCLSEKEYSYALDYLSIPQNDRDTFIPHDKFACVHTFNCSGGQIACIVCLSVDKKVEQTFVYGLLVHEAVHIWQQHIEHIGENSPSYEFEAYAIQMISQSLIDEYLIHCKVCK